MERRKGNTIVEAHKIIDFSHYRTIEAKKPKRRKRPRKKGSIIARGKKLWVGFYYRGERVREPSGLEDAPYN